MKAKIVYIALALVLVLSFSLVTAVPAVAATTINVPGDYSTIQAAIDAANPGDTINVAAGTYPEYLHITTDGLTIQGAGIDKSIIDLDGLTPYWHYAMLSSSFSGRGGVSIDGYQNTGGETDLIENITFKGFTVKNAGVNPPVTTGNHTGANNAAVLTDSTASWTLGALVGQWVTSASDYVDNSGGRQFFRAQITANTDTSLTATYISGGDEKDWDTGDTYVISPYREWYDGALEGRDDVRGIRIVSGKNITIEDCKVEYSGGSGITSGSSRFGPKKPSENITITGCTISDNHHGGISMGATKGTATITHNTVSRNNNPVTEGCTYSGGVGPPDCHVTGMHISGRSTSLTLSGTISDNTVSDNAYIGISIHKYTDGFVVENNTVIGHNLNSEGAGIFLSTGWGFTKHCRNHIVRNNTVTGNIRGIIAYYAWDSTIEGNTITTDSGSFDAGQSAIKIDHAYNITVEDNNLSSLDGLGIELTSSDTTGNTISSGNTITGALGAGIYIRSGAHDNTFTGNTIRGTTNRIFTFYADWDSQDGGDDQATLTDSTKSWTTDAFVGMTVINLADGSEGTITANTATTVTAALSGGTENDWDNGDDYDIVYQETQGDGVFLRGGSCYAGGHAGTGNVFHYNNIEKNKGDGMENQTATTVNATCNWWGHYSGPGGDGPGVGDAVSSNVVYDPWLVLPAGSEFEIEKATIKFKKKADDDKAHVKGHLGTLCLAGGVAAISDNVKVTVGLLSETITMVEKGKKGEKWEYKRLKGVTGPIKHMKIDWKKGKFDIHMDKADLSGLTDPDDVTISISIGSHDFGEQTITMTVKKDKWEYKAH